MDGTIEVACKSTDFESQIDMKTLVIAPNWIGDAIMTEPLIADLSKTPGLASIDVLAPPATAPVYRMLPAVREVLEAPLLHGKLQLKSRWHLAQRLSERGYQHAFVLPNSLKSALIPWLARIPKRTGYLGEHRYGLLNDLVKPPSSSRGERPPMVEHYFALSKRPPTDGPLLPKLSIRPDDASEVATRFGIERAFVALCPGAEFGPSKRWPTRHFAALADIIAQEHPEFQLMLIGGKADRPLATEIAAYARAHVINACGETQLLEAFSLLALADGVVSNDSGLMHAAAAFRRPQAAIFGSTDPMHTPPLNPRAIIVRKGLTCSPCFERRCPLNTTACLNEIAPRQVWEALSSSMQKTAH